MYGYKNGITGESPRQAEKAAAAGEEAARTSREKAALSRSRAIGARKCAIEAADSEARAREQYDMAEERRAGSLFDCRPPSGPSVINYRHPFP